MGNNSLPEHAQWRYKTVINRFKGRADITITDRETGARVTHADVQTGRAHRIPEDNIAHVLRLMVRLADSRRPAGDIIGDAARAAIAVDRLGITHAKTPELLVDPMAYWSVLVHLSDLADGLADLGEFGAAMCDTLVELSEDVDEMAGAELWRTIRGKLNNVRAGALGAFKAAGSAARTVSRAVAYGFTCGDCVEGICHWGGGNNPGGRLATAQAHEAAGERCDCSRHDVSVRMRAAMGSAADPDGPYTLDPPLTPAVPAIIDDPVRPNGPPSALLAKLAARGMVELTRPVGLDIVDDVVRRDTAVYGSDVMRLEVPASLGGPCGSPLACCPEHGATLQVIGGRPGDPLHYTKCRRPECGRTWEGDRHDAGCDQIATYTATAPEVDPATGQFGSIDVCRGHADQLIEWGWSVRTRPNGDPGSNREADEQLAERCRRAARRRSVVTAATELVTRLGYHAREVSDAMPSYRGVFEPIVMHITGRAGAGLLPIEATFTHDHTIDVFTFSTGWYPAAGSERLSWPALVERLALTAGVELPACVVAAAGADGALEAVAEDLAAYGRSLAELGFATHVDGDPLVEVRLMLAGYGRSYRALFRYDRSIGALVFAGGWLIADLTDERPLTWSTWPAFLAALRVVAEGDDAGAVD